MLGAVVVIVIVTVIVIVRAIAIAIITCTSSSNSNTRTNTRNVKHALLSLTQGIRSSHPQLAPFSYSLLVPPIPGGSKILPRPPNTLYRP